MKYQELFTPVKVGEHYDQESLRHGAYGAARPG